MKVQMHRIRFESIERVLPDNCSKCGADFTSSDMNLGEVRLDRSIDDAQISAGPAGTGGLNYLEYGDGNTVEAPVFVTGYVCQVCDHVLIDLVHEESADEDEDEDGEVE